MPETASLASQRIQVQEDDPIELLYSRGVTDGLPVIPPTEGRVNRMLAATDRDSQELIGSIGPNYGRATIEKDRHQCGHGRLPSVLFSDRAGSRRSCCEEQFCIHGINVTTFSASPMVIINGPIRQQIGVNCGHNALGHGFRANATIGRAFRLMHYQHRRRQATRNYQSHNGSSCAIHILCGRKRRRKSVGSVAC